MKKLLVLTYHYPPVGGAAVQRNVQLLRHLPDFGYEPVVITGSGSRSSRWTPRDDSLKEISHARFDVFRVAGDEVIPESGRWRSRLERWAGVQKPWSRWWDEGVTALARRVGTSVDLVYAPLVPLDSFHGALNASRVLEKPLVVDFHDPWAFDEMMVYPTRLHRWSAARTMRRVIDRADGVVLNTPEATSRVARAFPELRTTPLATISNGFSGEDFAGPPAVRSDDVFRIMHTGYLHTELGRERNRLRLLHDALGGALGKVDILTRSHVYLLRAVEDLLSAHPHLGPVEIHLAGVLTSADRDVAGGSSLVHFHGYLPHDQTVALLRSADLLFLPMQNIEAGRRVGIVPGKTYEYIAARRPILAAVPDGDVRDLLRSVGGATICEPDDVAGMRAALRRAIERKRNGGPEPLGEPLSPVEEHDWRNRSRDLARLFDQTLDARRPTGA